MPLLITFRSAITDHLMNLMTTSLSAPADDDHGLALANILRPFSSTWQHLCASHTGSGSDSGPLHLPNPMWLALHSFSYLIPPNRSRKLYSIITFSVFPVCPTLNPCCKYQKL